MDLHDFLTILEKLHCKFGLTNIYIYSINLLHFWIETGTKVLRLLKWNCIPLLHWYRWIWTSMMKSDLVPCCSRCRHCSLMMLFHAHFFYKKLGPETAELTIKISRSRNKIVMPKLLPKTNDWICFSILKSSYIHTRYVRLALLRGLATAICQNINIPNLYNCSG